jgi:glycosyltransferase involved in cell wall biosynthesis
MNNKSSDRILIIIPCFNEQESIIPLLKEINSTCHFNYSTIVINDCSTDNTARLAAQLSPVVTMLSNQGIGGAVHVGIKYALENDFDFCVQIDGDGQHPPSEITKLLKAYQTNPKNITIGSRYLKNNTFRSTGARRLGSKIIARCLNFLFKSQSITDPTSGMRLMDRDAINYFSKHYPYDFPEPISLALAIRYGLCIGEEPVEMRSRMFGFTSITGLKTIAYMIRVISYIILIRFVYSPFEKRSVNNAAY